VRLITVYLLILTAFIACGNNNSQKAEGAGTIEADEIRITARIPGEVEDIRIKQGQRVQRGDTLIILDHEALEWQQTQALQAKNAAESQWQLMVQGARQEDIQLAQALTKEAEANFQLAENDYKRFEELYHQNSATEKQWQEMQARYEIASAKRKSAQLNLTKTLHFFRNEELKGGRARYEQAAAAWELARLRFKDAFSTAPRGGIITACPIEIGEYAMMGTPMCVISRLDTVNLVIYLQESMLSSIRYGSEATITLDDQNPQPLKGYVSYISPQAEFTPKNIQTREDRIKLVFAVEIEIPNAGLRAKPGLPADAEILIDIPLP